MSVINSVFEAVRLSESDLREAATKTMDELMFEIVEYPISCGDYTSNVKIQRYFVVEQKKVESDEEHMLEYAQIVKFANKITTSDNHVCYILKVYYRLMVGSALFEDSMMGEKGIADEAPGFYRDKPGYLDITDMVGMDLGMERRHYSEQKKDYVISRFSYVLTRRTHKNARLFYFVC